MRVFYNLNTFFLFHHKTEKNHATHHNTKPYSKYIAAKIPASLIGTKTMLTIEFNTSKIDTKLKIREIGTHDLFPGDV